MARLKAWRAALGVQPLVLPRRGSGHRFFYRSRETFICSKRHARFEVEERKLSQEGARSARADDAPRQLAGAEDRPTSIRGFQTIHRPREILCDGLPHGR
jgi:hypothetical protein